MPIAIDVARAPRIYIESKVKAMVDAIKMIALLFNIDGIPSQYMIAF